MLNCEEPNKIELAKEGFRNTIIYKIYFLFRDKYKTSSSQGLYLKNVKEDDFCIFYNLIKYNCENK